MLHLFIPPSSQSVTLFLSLCCFFHHSIAPSQFLTSVFPDLPLVLPGQFSTVGRAASSCVPTHQQKTIGEDLEESERAEIRKEKQSSARRIRAPTGEGMSGLMASLTCSSHVESCQEHSSSCCSPSSEVRSLPRLATNSSLNSEASCNSTSYRTLSTSSSCCQVSLGKNIVK